MYTSKMMIVVRHDLKMRKGKIAAQSGHACVEAILAALAKEDRLQDICFEGDWATLKPTNKPATPLSEWFEKGMAKICVYVNSEEELKEIDRKAKEAGIISVMILDAGMTEFHGEPTYTCLAFEPQPAEVVAPITGDLPLY